MNLEIHFWCNRIDSKNVYFIIPIKFLRIFILYSPVVCHFKLFFQTEILYYVKQNPVISRAKMPLCQGKKVHCVLFKNATNQ